MRTKLKYIVSLLILLLISNFFTALGQECSVGELHIEGDCRTCQDAQLNVCFNINNRTACGLKVGCTWTNDVYFYGLKSYVWSGCVVDKKICRAFYEEYEGSDGCCQMGFRKVVSPADQTYKCYGSRNPPFDRRYISGIANKKYCSQWNNPPLNLLQQIFSVSTEAPCL